MKWGVFVVLVFILASCQSEVLTVADVANYEPRMINYSDSTAVVAIVNGEELRVADVASSAIRYGVQPTIEIFDELLEGLILARLATQSGEPVPEAELEIRIDEIAGNLSRAELEAILAAEGLSIGLIKERIREEIVLQRMIERDVVSPSDDEVRDFYAQNAAAFVTPERVVVRHFFVSNATRSPEEQLEILQGYLDAEPEERCAYLERFTDDRSSADPEVCGLLAITRGTAIPELEYGAYGTPPGITQVVPSRFGTHIVTGEGVVPASSLTLEEAEPTVREILAERERIRIADRALSDLLEGASITIYFSR
jgi:parvulin-like peptidyl-prolyl isomerase